MASRVSTKLQAFDRLLRAQKVTCESQAALYAALEDFFRPEAERTPEDIMQENLAKLDEMIKNVQPGTKLNRSNLAQAAGIDATRRADMYLMRKHVANNPALEYVDSKSEHWVKRLTHETSGTAD